MNKEYFTDNLSIEDIAEMTDKMLRFENNQKIGKKKVTLLKIIPAAAAIVLIIGLINILSVLLNIKNNISDNGSNVNPADAINSRELTHIAETSITNETETPKELSRNIDFNISFQPIQYNENPFSGKPYNSAIVNKIIHTTEELIAARDDGYDEFLSLTENELKKLPNGERFLNEHEPAAAYSIDLTYFYDDEYFKDNALIAVTFDYSLSIPKFIYRVQIYDDRLTAWAYSFEDMSLPKNEKFTSGLYTARVFLIEVKKSDIDGITEVFPGLDCAPVIYIEVTQIGGLIITTPEGKAPIQNGDGTITLPMGSSYEYSDEKYTATDGIVINDDGTIDMSLPANIGKPLTIELEYGILVFIDENRNITVNGHSGDDMIRAGDAQGAKIIVEINEKMNTGNIDELLEALAAEPW